MERRSWLQKERKCYEQSSIWIIQKKTYFLTCRSALGTPTSWIRRSNQGLLPRWRAYFKIANLTIILIVNPNPTASAIYLCYCSVGKMGVIKVKQNTINKKPKETLTTSPSMTVDKKGTMCGTMSTIHRQNLKRMQKHSEKWSKKSIGTSPLMDNNKKHCWMLMIHHAVSLWESSPTNGMISHPLDSCSVRPHHKKYYRQSLSLIKSKKRYYTTKSNP